MRGSLEHAERSALRTGTNSLHVLKDAGGNEAFCNVEVFYVHAKVMIGICNSGLEKLFDVFANQLVGVLEDLRSENSSPRCVRSGA